MRNGKSIEEKIASFVDNRCKLEEIANLCKVEAVKDDIVGLLCSEVSFDLCEDDEEKHDWGEDIAENLHAAEGVALDIVEEELAWGLRGDEGWEGAVGVSWTGLDESVLAKVVAWGKMDRERDFIAGEI